MKKLIFTFTFIMLVLTVSVSSFAATPHLYDGANFFNQAEEEQIYALLDEYTAKNSVNFCVMTVDECDTDAEYIATEYYEYNIGGDGILLFLSRDRYYYLLTSGSCIEEIDYDELGYIEDTIVPYFSDNDYVATVESFVVESDYYFNAVPVFPLGGSIFFSLILGVIVALIATSIMKGQLKTVKPQKIASNYIINESFKLHTSNDLYLYSTITKTRRASNNSSGSSRTHTSSSGRSYGGRGGRV